MENLNKPYRGVHKSVGIAEFFQKNKHMLGFDNRRKALVTALREIMDNSLDACEDYAILPNLKIVITHVAPSRYRLTVFDNGPGIPGDKIAKVFGKLLYGTKFHAIRQNRGAQGIGVSAVVMYAQTTTGVAATITSQQKGKKPIKVQIKLNVKTNEPELIKLDVLEELPQGQGTIVSVLIEASYVHEGDHGIKQFIKKVSLVNPHAKIEYIGPTEKPIIHERVISIPPKIAVQTKPYPGVVNYGFLEELYKLNPNKTIRSVLEDDIFGLSQTQILKLLKDLCVYGDQLLGSLDRLAISKLVNNIKKNYVIPNADSLNIMGEYAMTRALHAKDHFKYVYYGKTNVGLVNGCPFVVEVGLAYGGQLDKTTKIELMRIANRTPLIYKPGSCLITRCVKDAKWRTTGLNQTPGELPYGPALILIHVAGAKLPYSAQSKENLADSSEVKQGINLAIESVINQISNFIKKVKEQERLKSKFAGICETIPRLGEISKLYTGTQTNIDYGFIMSKIMGSAVFENFVSKIVINNYSNVGHIIKITNPKKSRILFVAPWTSNVNFTKGLNTVWRVISKKKYYVVNESITSKYA